MPTKYQQVPQWTSGENQGANVAAADLDKDGIPELIVLRVDHPNNGTNKGFYRVGRRLDSEGNVKGGWGPWLEVPNWAAAENQGVGVAVADLDGDGNSELIVFQIDHRTPGPNRGRFCIGRKLDPEGKVAGWSSWQDVPEWISWRDQGAAIAVGNVSGKDTAELVVFHIDDFHTDNPNRPNKGFYRVGFGLSVDGSVRRWGDWQQVDWFSWFNRGAGVALADLDGNHRPELIVYAVDAPADANFGFCRVGWRLSPEGKVQDGWGPWEEVARNGTTQQSGGFALADFPGEDRPRLIAFHIEDRPEENAGLYAVLPLDLDIDRASEQGIWRVFPYLSEVLPVHGALLHTGKLLFFAGSGNNFVRFQSPDFGNVDRKVYTSVVWDVTSGVFDHPPTLRREDGSVIDFFCCGHCFLPDGRVLVAGGTQAYDKQTGGSFHGCPDTLIFDPIAETWSSEPSMAHGRWYPSLVMLADDQVVVASGIDEKGNNNGTLEVRKADHPGWIVGRDFNLPLYPHLFLLSDGHLFFTGGKMDTAGNSQPFRFDPLTTAASQNAGGLLAEDHCNQAASVLLAPAQRQQFMIIGGGPEDFGDATDRVDVIDLGPGGNATYRPTASLNFSRLHVNAVLLPDRTVLAVGGAQSREASQGGTINPQAVRERLVAERWDPSLDAPDKRWAKMAAASVPRLYHSVALLLPDGRVISAGGNPDKGNQVPWLPPDPNEEMRLEIYSPPYLFKDSRPVIADAPQTIEHGQLLKVRTPQAAQIKWVNLLRPGLTTHSFNGEQRLIDLPIQTKQGDSIQTKVTDSSAIAPRGWYMLFLTDNDGIPSVARWIQVT